MADILDSCGAQLRGWYESPDRIRIKGTLRHLQQPGSLVNWMKLQFPQEAEPLRWFGHFTGRLRHEVETLVEGGVAFFDADPPHGKKYELSDRPVQQWLARQYATGPRPGALVAIVRTRECARSFSCRPRRCTRAKGHPKTGVRPAETAHHHLLIAHHNIHVYYFFVMDPQWGRASLRLPSYLPFEVTLQLNGHDYLARQMTQRRWQFAMRDNAVAQVSDWQKLRALVSATDYEQAIRRFAARWLARLPHGLTAAQLEAVGGYHWTVLVLESSLNYVFREPAGCQSVFEQLLRHNLLLGAPDSLRTLFEMSRAPKRSSNKLTVAFPMRCLKAFYGPNWLKFYDKAGQILRFEMVFNDVTMFVANKSLSNLGHLLALGHNVCRRLERGCATAAACPVRARDHTLLESVDDDHGRRFGGIRAERRAEQLLLAALLWMGHHAAGFSNREFRRAHAGMTGERALKGAQASYRLRKYRAHGLVEPIGASGRRYQLTERGRRCVALLLKVFGQLLRPVEAAIRDGLLHWRDAVRPEALDSAMNNVYVALGLVPT